MVWMDPTWISLDIPQDIVHEYSKQTSFKTFIDSFIFENLKLSILVEKTILKRGHFSVPDHSSGTPGKKGRPLCLGKS